MEIEKIETEMPEIEIETEMSEIEMELPSRAIPYHPLPSHPGIQPASLARLALGPARIRDCETSEIGLACELDLKFPPFFHLPLSLDSSGSSIRRSPI